MFLGKIFLPTMSFETTQLVILPYQTRFHTTDQLRGPSLRGSVPTLGGLVSSSFYHGTLLSKLSLYCHSLGQPASSMFVITNNNNPVTLALIGDSEVSTTFPGTAEQDGRQTNASMSNGGSETSQRAGRASTHPCHINSLVIRGGACSPYTRDLCKSGQVDMEHDVGNLAKQRPGHTKRPKPELTSELTSAGDVVELVVHSLLCVRIETRVGSAWAVGSCPRFCRQQRWFVVCGKWKERKSFVKFAAHTKET